MLPYSLYAVFALGLLVQYNDTNMAAKATKAGNPKQSIRSKTESFLMNELYESNGLVAYFVRQTVCELCKMAVNVTRILALAGLPYHFYTEAAYFICKSMKLANEQVCHGYSALIQDEIMYIAGNSEHSDSTICSTYLGSDICASRNFYSDMGTWTVQIPMKNQVNTSKITYNNTKNKERAFTFLHISDIHIDPEYLEGSISDCGEILCCRNSSRKNRGGENKDKMLAGKWGTNGLKCDIPTRTVESMFQYIRSNFRLDFIIFTGDVPAHDTWNQSRETNMKSLINSVKTIKQYFPNTPIFPSLGNHEAYPFNSYPIPEVYSEYNLDYLYLQLNESWRHLFEMQDYQTVLKGGYYNANITEGLNIISLNTNYGNPHNLWLMINDTDPTNQLQWLTDQLKSAEDKNQKVLLIGHIPPSLATYNWGKNMNSISIRFQDTIVGQFYGHFHLEKTQIIYENKHSLKSPKPIGVSYIGPSVTTYGNCNPGFRVVTLDGKSFEPIDYFTYYLNIEEANKMATAPWKLLYSAKETFGLKSLHPAEWDAFTYPIKHNDTTANIYKMTMRRNVSEEICKTSCKNRLICDMKTYWVGAAKIYC